MAHQHAFGFFLTRFCVFPAAAESGGVRASGKTQEEGLGGIAPTERRRGQRGRLHPQAARWSVSQVGQASKRQSPERPEPSSPQPEPAAASHQLRRAASTRHV